MLLNRINNTRPKNLSVDEQKQKFLNITYLIHNPVPNSGALLYT